MIPIYVNCVSCNNRPNSRTFFFIKKKKPNSKKPKERSPFYPLVSHSKQSIKIRPVSMTKTRKAHTYQGFRWELENQELTAQIHPRTHTYILGHWSTTPVYKVREREREHRDTKFHRRATLVIFNHGYAFFFFFFNYFSKKKIISVWMLRKSNTKQKKMRY